MRLTVDSLFLRDPRVRRLAMLVHRHVRHVRGDLLEIWEVCFLRRTATLEALDIDAQGEMEGYAKAMIKAGLATETSDGIRVCGVDDRLRWLLSQDEKRTKANLARIGKVADKQSPPGRPQVDTRHSPGKSLLGSEIWDLRSDLRDLSLRGESPVGDLPPLLDPIPWSDPDPASAASQSAPERPKRPRAPAKPRSPESTQRAVEEFDALFRARRGANPDWSAKNATLVHALAKRHGVDEVVRRAGVMFDLAAAGKWPAEGGGDVSTLSVHFDKFAAAPVNGLSASGVSAGFGNVIGSLRDMREPEDA